MKVVSEAARFAPDYVHAALTEAFIEHIATSVSSSSNGPSAPNPHPSIIKIGGNGENPALKIVNATPNLHASYPAHAIGQVGVQLDFLTAGEAFFTLRHVNDHKLTYMIGNTAFSRSAQIDGEAHPPISIFSALAYDGLDQIIAVRETRGKAGLNRVDMTTPAQLRSTTYRSMIGQALNALAPNGP